MEAKYDCVSHPYSAFIAVPFHSISAGTVESVLMCLRKYHAIKMYPYA
jgi:hypothetical protein